MGILFDNKPKTSADYLKDISKSMKNSQKYEKQVARAQREAAWADAEAASAAASASRAEADEIRERTRQQKLAEEKADLKSRKDAFEVFLLPFNYYDTDNTESILNAASSMIQWLDTVDRSFENKMRKYEVLNEIFDDSDKHKEEVLIRRLALANEQLQKLGVKGSKADHIAQRLAFYEERQRKEFAEAEALKKLQRERTIKFGLIATVVVAVISVVVWLNNRPTAKNDDDICVQVVRNYVASGKLERAKKTLAQYEGFVDFVQEGYLTLVEAYINAGNIEEAKVVVSMGGVGKWLLCDELIKRGAYEEAKEYVREREQDYYSFIEDCVRHMCSKNQYEEARKFAKKESTFFIGKEEFTPNVVVKNMNTIIASYQ